MMEQAYSFRDNELEIAIITRSRGKIVCRFLEECINDIASINASLSIYDSSADDETEVTAKKFVDRGYKIDYHRLPYEYPLEEKYLDAIINAKSKYIWPIGDSVAVDFRVFAKKAKVFIEKEYDLIVCWDNSVKHFDGVNFQNVGELYKNCLWFMTWLGAEIYYRELYEGVLTADTKRNILQRVNNGYGSWYPQLGMLFDTLSQKRNIRTSVVTVNRRSLASSEKKQAWVKDSYRIWCRDLCLLADTSGIEYKDLIDEAIRETWRILKLDGTYWLCRSRVENGLNRELFDKYDAGGYIDRVSDKKKQIRKWAYCSHEFANTYYQFLKLKNRVRKFGSGFKYKIVKARNIGKLNECE